MVETRTDIKVAVLMGGISNEREISLQSGSMIAIALKDAGADVVPFDIAPDRLEILDDETIDIFFPALHGEFGEDGELQKILEDRKLCFAGSGSAASRIAIDKAACKEAVQRTGVALPLHIIVKLTDDIESLSKSITHLGEKVVIKPVSHGSSFGVKIVDNTAEAAKTAYETYEQYGSCMIEQFIVGREITVGILNGKTLPIIEILSERGFYDYDAKYMDNDTQYLFNTVEDKDVIDKINGFALECFNTVGCRHWGRVDMVLTEEGTPYFLEINTLPGFTSHSLLPMAANKAGLSNGQLCLEIANAALPSGR